MAQEPFIQSPQTETSVRQAFEDYIQSKKIEAEGKGQTWAAEKKYRTSLKLIEDAGIVLDNMSLKELNTEENIERIMTNERLLKGEKTVRGDRTFGKGNIRDLGNHLNTIFNNLRAGEANALASWNAKNKGKPNPNPKGPFKTLGFALTERDIPGQIKTAPDAVMLKAFRDTLNDIQDVQVGKTTIPAKTVKAHMLMSVVTGMRSPDINNFVSQINPSEEQLKATDSVKTFLRSDDKVMVINNKGKLTEYALNPTLYSILSDATQSASGEKVFPSAGSIEKSYLSILQDKLTQAGYPNVKQNVKGVLKDVPLSHNVLRKFAFSFVERIPEAEGGGTSNADALIQHKTKDRSIGETTYRAGTLGEFQTTKETTAQSAFLRKLIPDTTPAQFLQQQGFNASNFAEEIFDLENEADIKSLSSKTASSFAEKQSFISLIENDDTLSDDAKERMIKKFEPLSNPTKLFTVYRKEIESGYDAYKTLIESQNGVPVDEDDYFNKVAANEIQPASTRMPVTPDVPFQETQQEAKQPYQSQFDFTDTSTEEPLTKEQKLQRSSDFLNQLGKAAVKKVPAFLGGGIGLAATAIEEAFAATPTAVDEAVERPAPSTVRQADYYQKMPVPRTSEADTPQRIIGDEDRFIAQATDEGGMQYLDNLEKTYQRRVEAEQPAISTGIMRDSGITELDPRSINEEQLDKIRAARRDLQSQAAELFNRRN